MLAGVVKLIGASAIMLALGASAPAGALAQAPPSAPDAAAAVPAAAASGATVPGSSIRKPIGAASGGASPAANSITATPALAASTSASSPANGSSSDTTESAGAPAALATPATHKARHRAHPDDASRTASAKTESSGHSKDAPDSNGPDSPFSSLSFSGNKGPIDIRSDALDLDYKGNVVTFRGHVHALQGDAVLTSDTLQVSYGKDFHEVKEMVANSNVRMSQGARWATGDHAVLDQARHIVILTGSPVVHDGNDQVTGSKITVHLDTGKSEVEGARAMFFPKEQETRDNKATVAKSP